MLEVEMAPGEVLLDYAIGPYRRSFAGHAEQPYLLKQALTPSLVGSYLDALPEPLAPSPAMPPRRDASFTASFKRLTRGFSSPFKSSFVAPHPGRQEMGTPEADLLALLDGTRGFPSRDRPGLNCDLTLLALLGVNCRRAWNTEARSSNYHILVARSQRWVCFYREGRGQAGM
jgi:hypothetical protein